MCDPPPPASWIATPEEPEERDTSEIAASSPTRQNTFFVFAHPKMAGGRRSKSRF